MAYQKKQFKPTVSYYKILETISFLNERGFYPLPQGVGKILRGEIDEEIQPFIACPTYGSLVSYSRKKICRCVMMLFRYKYVEKVYDKKTDELYLKISTLGELSLLKFKKKHKNPYQNKSKSKKPTIVKLY